MSEVELLEPDAKFYAVSGKVPDKAQFQRAESFLVEAKELIIDSVTMYEMAADTLRSIKSQWQALEDQREAIVKPINAGVKAINALFKVPQGKCTEAETTLKNAMIAFDQKVEAERREQARIAEEAARKERARIEAEAAEVKRLADIEAARIKKEADDKAAAIKAESDRIAAEAKAAGNAAEAARIEAEAAANAEAQRLRDHARAEMEKADAEARAEQLKMEAEMVVAAPIAVVATAVKGVSTSRPWKARLTDKLALIKFVAEHPEYINLVDANDSALNALAKAQKDAMRVDGVEAYQDVVMSSRK